MIFFASRYAADICINLKGKHKHNKLFKDTKHNYFTSEINEQNTSQILSKLPEILCTNSSGATHILKNTVAKIDTNTVDHHRDIAELFNICLLNLYLILYPKLL